MILEFDRSFEKSLDKITDRTLLNRVEKAILKAEQADTVETIPNAKKLVGYSHYYRIKVGDYRLGFEKINHEIIRFILIEHRKEIYRRFP